ncbi:nucleotidyltransferase [Virgibacillus ainsalahensis]
MKACGLIVEYNPFHNGHLYHLQESKKMSDADCMIAVMSGSFLQRGEPAVIDKFHRTKAALLSGIDLVLELPYTFSVQSSDLFAKGAVHTLNEVGVSDICFGSESGNITDFITSYKVFKEKEFVYQEVLKKHLEQGVSFPEASRHAYKHIGLSTDAMDLTKPNNILGFSYVKNILEKELPITPFTIQRTKSGYHDQHISSTIASATSIRKELFASNELTPEIAKALPAETYRQLIQYKQTASTWHTWENYFQLIHYRVMTMSIEELAEIEGMDEGLEYRIKKMADKVGSMYEWIEAIKTKRYTWTRLQRLFAHILTNTTKFDMQNLREINSVPYIRILGMSKMGQTYINKFRKQLNIPMITKLSKNIHPMLALEEKASNAYYSILPPKQKNKLRKQEIQPPIRIE